MDVNIERSIKGLIELYLEIFMPVLIIIIYLLTLQFDFSLVQTYGWILMSLCILYSFTSLILYGEGLFLPKTPITIDHDGLHLHITPQRDVIISYYDILEVESIYRKRRVLRYRFMNRSYGKINIKTSEKTYTLYPIDSIEYVKEEILKARDKAKKDL